MTVQEPRLPYLTNEERLQTYQLIIDGCHHLWSKGKLQEEKALIVIKQLIGVAHKDPYFLAHFTSWAISRDAKDMKVMSVYANSLSSANGMPFSTGSKYSKPNLRYVSAAAIQKMNPKLALRVLQLEPMKFGVDGVMNEGRHFSGTLRTALKKYLKYRENNLNIVRGVKKSGLGNVYQNIYRLLHMAPSNEVAALLRWQQRGKKIKFEESVFDFKGLTPLQIAKKIRKDKLPILGVIGALPKMSPSIAVALLEQATGDQAVILTKTFEESGVLKDKEVKKLYDEKVATAKNAVDRVKSFIEQTSDDVRAGLKETKAQVRKKATQDIGKVFIHLDLSPSMEPALEVAKERGAIIAEMISNPAENFKWGIFNDHKEILPNPKEFVEDAFKAVLFGKICDGMTDAYLLYPDARQHGSECDIFISDGCHNTGDLTRKIREYHQRHPEVAKPKAMLWINVFNPEGNGYYANEAETIKKAYEDNEIPTATLKPEAITNSALVTEAVKNAMKGPMATIESIMETPLLELPEWYLTV